MAYVGQRFKTGEVCSHKGQYAFDGYVDGTSTPPPTAEERIIPLDVGDRFPPVNSADKGAWWKFSG